MRELSPEDLRPLAKAAGLEISDSDLLSVAHHLNALLETVEDIEAPGLELVEPMPVLPFPKETE